jgi:hypothetical protein
MWRMFSPIFRFGSILPLRHGQQTQMDPVMANGGR